MRESNCSCRSFNLNIGNVVSLFESLQFCKFGNIQRRDLFGALLYGKPSCTFILLLPTLHFLWINLNRGPGNHATHKHLGSTEHVLSIPLLLEYSLLIWTKSGELRYTQPQKERKIKQNKSVEENLESEVS